MRFNPGSPTRAPSTGKAPALGGYLPKQDASSCFAEYFTNPVSRRPCFKELRLIALPTTLNKARC